MGLVAGARLGPYEIERLVGAGGMGEVYRARDPRPGREVAVKVLPAEVASDPARLSLFEREARAVAALNHPNILTVHDVGTHDGTPYVVTELLEGETLRELVSRRAPTVQQILTYMLQAARGLEAAHAKGIVHRDLKPENLFLTTDGRVKVLDFGLAKLIRSEAEIASDISTAAQSTPPGQVAGTVLYMSPEQARAQSIDVRSDVFSFGVVLYELLAGRHPFRKDTLAGTLTAIAEETHPDLETLARGIPPSFGGIVRRCLEKAREDRYASGHDVVMVLEAVLLAPSAAAALQEVEERSPYPGLSSFTEKDATVFFGREREIESLWGRIPNRKLLAVIGPSGAGKTSFVRAGLLPARPAGWAAIVCTPGTHPFRALGQALGPELAGDPEALGKLAAFDEPDTAVDLVGRWQKARGEALLVMDQFEELLTLNAREVQERFAGLLGRVVSETDAHVVLSLRDDFLIRCCEHEPLAPVLEGLTALLALKPEDLRRAIEEPAKRQGYRFEDDELVAEMVESVEGARAALPLLAFAVSRLWEKRDRDKKVLTRAAYEEIGGVAGALAQHAEQTMDRIGSERQGMVREIFRNLVTSQGTRAVADREELLSVFPERDAAEKVLVQLIDARLLTSYEVQESPSEHVFGSGRATNLSGTPSGTASAQATHRIDIVHESLIKAWPRLVRWQAQEEEGAVLRDQLRQAAHLWEERGRSPDVLWSGTALREYELWRERYAGKLTVVEESFASAMLERERRRRRWRRSAVASLVAGLALVATVVTVSRHQAVRQAERAERQARLATAAEIVALGRNELERYPTAALAYARRSLEIADTAQGRRLALEALWRGPTARILELPEVVSAWHVGFSADGATLATAGPTDKIRLFDRNGGVGPVIAGLPVTANPRQVVFDRKGDLLASATVLGQSIHVHSRRDGSEVQVFDADPQTEIMLFDGSIVTWTPDPSSGHGVFREWSLGDEDPKILRRLSSVAAGGEVCGGGRMVDPQRRWIAAGEGRRVYLHPLGFTGRARLLGEHDERLLMSGACVAFAPSGSRLASIGESLRIRIWDPDRTGDALVRVLEGMTSPERWSRLRLDPNGTHAAWGSADDRSVYLWEAQAPRDADPLLLRRPDANNLMFSTFSADGRWLAVPSGRSVTLWPIERRHPSVLSVHRKGPVHQLAFSGDGGWLASCALDGVRLSPLSQQGTSGHPGDWVCQKGCYGLATEPRGSKLLVGAPAGPVYVVPIEGGEKRELMGSTWGDHMSSVGGVAFDSTGRWAAVGIGYSPRPEDRFLRVWDLESGNQRTFPLCDGCGDTDLFEAGVRDLRFAPDGTLFTGGSGGVLRWDVETGSRTHLLRGEKAVIDLSADARVLIAAIGEPRSFSLGNGITHLIDDPEGTSIELGRHGMHVSAVGVSPSGALIATGSEGGAIRVGTPTDDEPHLLLGHASNVTALAFSPDERWLASSSGTEIRIWPIPDLTKPPPHTLPYDELMPKLSALTNLEVVTDESSPTGYSLEVGPFPGWKEVPEW